MTASKRKNKPGPRRSGPAAKPAAESREFFDGIERKLGPVAVLVVLCAATAAYTHPLLWSLGNTLLGKFSNYYGDIFSGIWEFWVSKYQLLDLKANPFNYDVLSGPYASYWISSLAAHKYPVLMVPLTALLGPVVSLNLYILINFLLAGFFTWLLVRHLTGSSLAGVVSGLILAFCPYMYAHSVVHLDVAAVWPLPLTLYALLLFDRRPGVRSALLIVMGLVLFQFYCSIYYYFFVPLAAGCYLLVRFFNGYVYEFSSGARRLDRLSRVTPGRWLAVCAAGVVLVAAGILVYKFYLGPMAAGEVRPLHWQERFKLSWANYLLPGVDHPWFGKVTRGLVPIRRNVTEATAYLGWLPLVLALWGMHSARRDWRAWMFLIFGLVSLSFTIGPYLSLGYLRLPLPSLLLHKVAPFIRVISRYAVFVQLAVAVLAGYGVVRAAGALKGRKTAAAAAVGFLLVLAVEYLPPRESTVIAARPEDSPPVYRCLAGLEKDAVLFEYPPCAVTGLAMSEYLYFQTIHQKRLFNRHFENTTIPEDYLPLWWDLDYPGAVGDPNNLALLRYFGTDYLVFHDRSGTETPTLPPVGLENLEGLELVEDFGKEAVYRLTAEPATVLHLFDTRPFYNYLEIRRPLPALGFEAPQVLGDGRAWRIMHERGRLRLVNLLDQAQRVAVEVMAVSFEKPRALQVAVDRSLRQEFEVDTSPQPVRIPGIELPPGGEVELIFNSPEGVSRLPTRGGGTLEASVALASLRVLPDR